MEKYKGLASHHAVARASHIEPAPVDFLRRQI